MSVRHGSASISVPSDAAKNHYSGYATVHHQPRLMTYSGLRSPRRSWQGAWVSRSPVRVRPTFTALPSPLTQQMSFRYEAPNLVPLIPGQMMNYGADQVQPRSRRIQSSRGRPLPPPGPHPRPRGTDVTCAALVHRFNPASHDSRGASIRLYTMKIYVKMGGVFPQTIITAAVESTGEGSCCCCGPHGRVAKRNYFA